MTAAIRRARGEDIPELVVLAGSVQNLHSNEHGDLFPPSTELSGIDEFFQEKLADERQHVVVAELNGEVVGYLWAEVQRKPRGIFTRGSDCLYLQHLGVAPPYRSRGIGALLIDELQRIASANDISRITLDVWKFNERAQAFFARMGFSTYNVRMWKNDREKEGKG